MTTQKNYFLHSNESLQTRVQILNPDDTPANLDNYLIQFAVAKELTMNAIEVLSNANSEQISVVDANSAIIQINFKPTVSKGFTTDSNLVYQLQTTHSSNQKVSIIQEGRIFITPSLFDSIAYNK